MKNNFCIPKLYLHAKNLNESSKTECFIGNYSIGPALMAPTLYGPRLNLIERGHPQVYPGYSVKIWWSYTNLPRRSSWTNKQTNKQTDRQT